MCLFHSMKKWMHTKGQTYDLSDFVELDMKKVSICSN